MGWLHVTDSGKGIILTTMTKDTLHLDGLIPNYEYLQKYLKHFSDVEFAKCKSSYERLGYISSCLYAYRGEVSYDEVLKDIEYDYDYILYEGLSVLYEYKYGYPFGSFRSCSDYNGDKMFYCNIKYPLKDYNSKISTLTEATYLSELKDFFYSLTEDDYYNNVQLDFCEEYIKE